MTLIQAYVIISFELLVVLVAGILSGEYKEKR